MTNAHFLQRTLLKLNLHAFYLLQIHVLQQTLKKPLGIVKLSCQVPTSQAQVY